MTDVTPPALVFVGFVGYCRAMTRTRKALAGMALALVLGACGVQVEEGVPCEQVFSGYNNEPGKAQVEWDAWLAEQGPFTNLDYKSGVWTVDGVVIGYSETEDGAIYNLRECVPT